MGNELLEYLLELPTTLNLENIKVDITINHRHHPIYDFRICVYSKKHTTLYNSMNFSVDTEHLYRDIFYNIYGHIGGCKPYVTPVQKNIDRFVTESTKRLEILDDAPDSFGKYNFDTKGFEYQHEHVGIIFRYN
jgi:hypothetical protein